jgi:aspartate/methionine/tyrosine aminotransferase
MRPPFSRRTRWNLAPNRLAAVLEEARRASRQLADLTESNPTRCDFPSTAAWVRELGDARGTTYEPSPLGHLEAREAIAKHHRSRGAAIAPARVVTSASTSEAYGWLFKLLCDRDDAVLVPRPSYPLFDWLAAMEEVRLVPYPLVREEKWRVDLDAVERAIDDRTRAILIVHPNNPTGSFTRRDDAEALERIADRHGLALVVDEVFADYAQGALPADRLPTFAGRGAVLTFVMSGLSKLAALPQLKIGWTLVQGPDDVARDAMARLEMIADTYLSVATPVQRALPTILASIDPMQDAIRARVAENLRALDAAIARKNGLIRRLPIDGGWCAILEVPRTMDEDEWVETLVREEDVIVHPGYFFELDREGCLVVSLIVRSDSFRDAIERVVTRVGE